MDEETTKLLVVLQNAYDKGTLAEGFNSARWKSELARSLTGRKLARGIPEGAWRVSYTNASPILGAGPSSKPPACHSHLKRAVRRAKPDIVLAGGLVAERACVEVWSGPLLAIPHPACRVLTNDALDQCRQILESWPQTQIVFRSAIRQLRGGTELVALF